MKPFDNAHKYATKETGPKARQTLTVPEHNASGKGDAHMPDIGNISARGDSASSDTQDTWKTIGELARKLAEKQGGAA